MTDQRDSGQATRAWPNAGSGVGCLITAVIILVLSAIAVPQFRRARANARRNKCTKNLEQIAEAKDAFAREHGEGVAVSWDSLSSYVTVDDIYCPVAASADRQHYTCYELNSIGTDPTCKLLPEEHVITGE